MVSRLESRIRTADDLALFRVNPKAYATETSMDQAEAIDLFLHAAAVGLFQMEWNLVCASCGNTARSFRGLAKVDPHFICDERIGDASAYNLVRLHFDDLEVVIREFGGAIGDAIMATFVEPASGLHTAKQVAGRLEDFNRTPSSDLVLKKGLHRGHAIAVSSNDSIDYFGQTVNIAARIQAMAGPGQICLSEDVYVTAGVADLLAGVSVEREAGIMKGVTGAIPVYLLASS